MIKHMKIAIADALNCSNKQLNGLLFNTETNQELTGAEVREHLENELAEGRKYFTNCTNRTADGSCAGHLSEIKQA